MQLEKLTMYNFQLEFNRFFNYFNIFLDKKINSLSETAPKIIRDAMKYAVSDGGKRVRPVLCLATAEMLGVDFDLVKEYALAIELIHSYSLVHDDLPSMDNDDYRRGKFSTHKKFGEANGILCGDALLNYSFEVCLSKDNYTMSDIDAMRIIADFAGYNGMIAGQVLDLENEKNNYINEKDLYNIYHKKTAKLIIAPLLVSSCLANKKFYTELKDFGYNLGIMFQIIDDLLDVEGDIVSIGKTPNKDSAKGKITSINLFGLKGAKERAKFHYDKCIDAIKHIPNNDFFVSFTKFMFERKK